MQVRVIQAGENCRVSDIDKKINEFLLDVKLEKRNNFLTHFHFTKFFEPAFLLESF